MKDVDALNMGRPSVERLARILLWSLLSIAFITWVAERFVSPGLDPILHNIVLVALFIGVPVGILVARRPRQIERTGDRAFDDAIERMMDEESSRRGER